MRLLEKTSDCTIRTLSLVLICGVVLIVYYPALFGGFNSVDDPHIAAKFLKSPPLSDLLLPGTEYYFRPVLELSYYLDNKLWGMEQSFMHLENMLLHAANAILVFIVAMRVARHSNISLPGFPLYAALLFAVHPLNAEAVSWVAGRTDPLATIFILLSLLFLLKWRESKRASQLFLFMLTLLLGIFTKETALAFIPVSLLTVRYWPESPDLPLQHRKDKLLLSFLLLCVAVILLTFMLSSKSSSIFNFLNISKDGLLHNSLDFANSALIALGFYVKKMFVPVPLNFAIYEVNPAYLWLGVGASLCFIFLLTKGPNCTRLLFLAAFVVAAPAIVIGAKQVAWTLFAERYMYLPTAFFSIGFVSIGCNIFDKWQKPGGALPFFTVLLICCAFITMQRNFTWKDNLCLYQDTTLKSPNFGSAHNELGVELIKRGRLSEGHAHLELADKLNKRESIKMLIKANLMSIMVLEGDADGAHAYFYELFRDKQSAGREFLEILNKADNERLKRLEVPAEKEEVLREIMDTNHYLYLKTGDPFWLYRSGKMALLLHDKKMASECFAKSYATAPDGSSYKAAAKLFTEKLGKE